MSEPIDLTTCGTGSTTNREGTNTMRNKLNTSLLRLGRRIRALSGLIAVACLAALAGASPAHAFDVVDFSNEAVDSTSAVETRAGAHPFQVENLIQVSTAADPWGLPIPDGSIKDVIVDLPVGFVGNPSLPTCKLQDLIWVPPTCPLGSQVGVMTIGILNTDPFVAPVFNVEPTPGVPAQFAFSVASVPTYINATVRPDDHGLRVKILNNTLALPIVSTQLEFWGVPSSPVHDAERGGPSGAPIVPFLSNSTDCSQPPTTKLRINSWQDPQFKTFTYVSDDLVGCENLDFDVSLKAKPSSSAAATPSGYHFELTTAQDDNPEGLKTADLKKAVVTLPEGTAINPSAAGGLQACSPAEIGLGTDSEVDCPPASKVGTVEIHTPLLADPMKGAIYQAAQNDNPFSSTLAIYLVPEGSGITLKLPGEIKTDPTTGKITTTFDDNPQLPFTKLRLDFKGGSRAPLVNPPTCGTKTTEWSMSSWAQPDQPLSGSDSFQITSGPNGTPCAQSEADRPFNPQMSAGVTNPTSASYSPFVFRLTREDGEQEILSTTVTPPQGVTAKLAGIPLCTDAQANAGSCPEASRVGTTVVGAGAGSNPFYIQSPNEGHVYLTGPYKGAQLGMLIQVPAVAGPLDLGMVNVRAAVQIDKRTAQLSVISDPIPQILEGIPLKVKDIRIKMDREQFTLAGTNCDPMQVGATVQGSHGATASLANRFQLGDCASLGFNPKLKLDFGNKKKDTKRNQHPPLKATLSFNEGDANISSVQVALPEGVLLDQERIGKVCSREAYAASSCPAASQVGYAKATTPLLDNPVEGPVYLKASDNVLPDLAADLNGQIDIDLFGRIDQREGKRVARIQNTFDVVPDVPVSDFELTLAGGNDGLLVNSSNVCKSKRSQRVSIDMQAHNEMSTSSNPLIGSACKQINKKKAKKLKRKAAKLLRKAKKANSKKKSKKLRKQARKLKKQARKLGR